MNFPKVLVILFLACSAPALLSAQPAVPVLYRFADMVDPNYWAGQTNERFREFLEEFLPDLRSLIDEAVGARWPAAGNMSGAGSALQQLARGNLT